jgi:hypothetical protein
MMLVDEIGSATHRAEIHPHLPKWDFMQRLENAYKQKHVSYVSARCRVRKLYPSRQSNTNNLPQASRRDHTSLLGNLLPILEHEQRRQTCDELIHRKIDVPLDVHTDGLHSSGLELRLRSGCKHLSVNSLWNTTSERHSSSRGRTIFDGPIHAAQKNTSTGSLALSTSFSKSSPVMLMRAIVVCVGRMSEGISVKRVGDFRWKRKAEGFVWLHIHMLLWNSRSKQLRRSKGLALGVVSLFIKR